MINEDLLKYLESEFAKGTPKDVIQSNLLSNGWDKNDIVEGISAMSTKSPVIPVQIPVVPKQPVTTISPTFPVIDSQNTKPFAMPLENYQATKTQVKKSHVVRTAIIVIAIIAILFVGAFLYYSHVSKNILSNTEVSETTQNIATTTLNNSTSTIQDISGVYNNTKFGYEITLNDDWHIPVDITKLYDFLMNKMSSTTTESDLASLSSQWKPKEAESIMITDSSLADEKIFYDNALIQKNAEPAGFPGNHIFLILVHSDVPVTDTAATDTPTLIIKKIIIHDKYNGTITTKPGRSFIMVRVEFASAGKLSDGNTPNMITFSSDTVSAEDLLKVVNTLVY